MSTNKSNKKNEESTQSKSNVVTNKLVSDNFDDTNDTGAVTNLSISDNFDLVKQ